MLNLSHTAGHQCQLKVIFSNKAQSFFNFKERGMEETHIRDKNLFLDFQNLTKYFFKKECSDFLWQKCMMGKLKIVVGKHLKDDGETSFDQDRKSGSKKSTVKIKKSVSESVHACWRMAILLHELLHAYHYLSTNNNIFENETHGEEWRIIVQTATERGSIKECAKKLVSPIPRCIYHRHCVWCPSSDQKVSRDKVYSLPRVLEKSKFGGNCEFCFTDDRLMIHLKRSNSCNKKYSEKYGPRCKDLLQKLTQKEKRAMKREGKKNLCMFCPAPFDKSLKVHFRANTDCEKKYMKKYECSTKEELSKVLKTEGNRLRKQKQRAKGNK